MTSFEADDSPMLWQSPIYLKFSKKNDYHLKLLRQKQVKNKLQETIPYMIVSTTEINLTNDVPSITKGN